MGTACAWVNAKLLKKAFLLGKYMNNTTKPIKHDNNNINCCSSYCLACDEGTSYWPLVVSPPEAGGNTDTLS